MTTPIPFPPETHVPRGSTSRKKYHRLARKLLCMFATGKTIQDALQWVVTKTQCQGGYISRVTMNETNTPTSLICLALAWEPLNGPPSGVNMHDPLPIGAEFPIRENALHTCSFAEKAPIVVSDPVFIRLHQCPAMKATCFAFFSLRVGDKILGQLALSNRRGGFTKTFCSAMRVVAHTLSVMCLTVMTPERIPSLQVSPDNDQAYRIMVEKTNGMTMLVDASMHMIQCNINCLEFVHRAFDVTVRPGQSINEDMRETFLYRGLCDALDTGENSSHTEVVTIGGLEEYIQCSFYPLPEYQRAFFMGNNVSHMHRNQKRLNEAFAREKAFSVERAEFFSRVSHELRTPIHAVGGFAEILKRQLEGGVKKLELIHEAASHITSIVNDIIDLTRVQAENIHLSFEPMSFYEVVEHCVEMLTPMATSHNVTLIIEDNGSHHCRPSDPVMADKVRLSQALYNVLQNAIKYNKNPGRVFLAVCSKGSYVQAVVRDTGIGIADDKLPGVFEEFNRLGMETSNITGTGLGMSVTKALIERMGGSVQVESTLGVGTTVTIALPATKQSPYVASASSNPTSARTVWKIAPDVCYTVLYIEDNTSNKELLVQIIAMEFSNVTITHVDTLSRAIEWLKNNARPSGVCTDLGLPDAKRTEVVQRLRSVYDGRIIVNTADATVQHAQWFTELENVYYVPKPCTSLEEMTTAFAWMLDLHT